jgi:hypothetical protein
MLFYLFFRVFQPLLFYGSLDFFSTQSKYCLFYVLWKGFRPLYLSSLKIMIIASTELGIERMKFVFKVICYNFF